MTVHAAVAPAHLREALASIAGQTLPPGEVIVVADGPLPPALEAECARAREQGLPLVLVRIDENRGPGAARNAGVQAAPGEYAAFLDADDRCCPERLARQRTHLEETGADVAGSWCRFIDAQGPVRAKQTPVSTKAIRRWAWLVCPMVQSSVFGRRAVFLRHPYPEGMRTAGAAFDGEDYALWVAMLRAGVSLVNLPECLVDYRLGERFFERRRGWGPFKTDWAAKRQALALLPLGPRLAAAVPAFLSACTRLLPAPLLAPFYALRNRWRFTRPAGGG